MLSYNQHYTIPYIISACTYRGKSRPLCTYYPDEFIDIITTPSTLHFFISWLDRCLQEVYSHISSNTTSEGYFTSIKKCGDQLLGRELCRKPCAFYRGSWYANQYAPIVDVRLLTRFTVSKLDNSRANKLQNSCQLKSYVTCLECIFHGIVGIKAPDCPLY